MGNAGEEGVSRVVGDTTQGTRWEQPSDVDAHSLFFLVTPFLLGEKRFVSVLRAMPLALALMAALGSGTALREVTT